MRSKPSPLSGDLSPLGLKEERAVGIADLARRSPERNEAV